MIKPGDIASEKARMRPLARRMRGDAFSPRAAAQLITHYAMALQSMARESMAQQSLALGDYPVVAGYWPLGGEIDPRPLMAHLAAAGAVIALPRMLARAAPPVFLEWKFEDPLEADAFGVLAPLRSAAMVAPALILVPLLGFDRLGGRLGQGGGHYDRVLAQMRIGKVVAMGLAFAGQEMPVIPLEPHDQRLDWVITECEAIDCR